MSSSQDGIAIDDKAMAVDVLRKYKINDDIKQIAKVTRFGSGYDFRNKRLPVWRIETVKQKVYFVDVVTASIVDEVMSFKKIEQFVFTYAHKWNFLKPVLGRKGRDIMLVFILFALSSLGVLGMLMRFRRK